MPIIVEESGGAYTEQLIFDPEEDTYSTGPELDVMASPYGVVSMDFPAPRLELSLAGSIDTEGEAPYARKHSNRTVTLAVEVYGNAPGVLESNLEVLEAKVAKVARSGGTLRHVTASGAYRTLDLLAADSYEPVFDVKRESGIAQVTIGLLAKPYARDPEAIVGAQTSETTLPVLVFEPGAVGGDVEAWARLVVSEAQGQAQRRLIWAFEIDHVSSSPDLFMQAEAMTLTSGTVTAEGTASGGNMVRTSVLGVDWRTFGYFTERFSGRYRVWARVKTASDGTSLRVRWGSLTTEVLATGNPAPIEAAASVWELIPIGVVSYNDPYGADNVLQIQAHHASAGVNVDIDWIMLQPLDYAAGVATGTASLYAVDTSGWFTVFHDAARKGNLPYIGVNKYEGDYAKVPPAEAVRVVVKMNRGASSGTAVTSEDPGIDDLAASLYITPRYLSMI